MALNNDLLISWNFDTVTGSDGSGGFAVDDTSTTYAGKGFGFSSNTTSFLLKEDIKTGKKQHFETLEGIDTIQLVDNDDERLSGLEKPSSVKLMIENSMYQIISDEMLNMFATVDNYAFKFTLPDNKYKAEYDRLIEARHDFFEKVLDKPNLEKYIEFYKWIDSSLGALIDQLKPESSSDFSGLKTTVESHILERNKFQHKLPITIQSNRVFTNSDRSITVVRSVSGSSGHFVSDTIDSIVSVDNVEDRNFSNNYEVIQSAGRVHNNRGDKTNKTIIQTRFSAVDGLSEQNRDSSGEFSVYNETNQRARFQRDEYNVSQSQQTGQGTYDPGDFKDNAFIQRNIPYTASNYVNTGVINYQALASDEVEFRQRNNLLIDNGEYSVIEPPIQFGLSAKHIIKVNGAFEDIEIESPYATKFNTFSPRTLQQTGTVKNGFYATFDHDIGTLSDSNTFYRQLINAPTGQIDTKRVEVLDYIYPRKDLMGRAETRTKPNYEEVEGNFITASGSWSNNSYNNNSAEIRSFWRNSIEDRKRTRGVDTVLGTGSINCLSRYNLSGSSSFVGTDDYVPVYSNSSGICYVDLKTTFYDNYYDSMWSLDGKTVDTYGAGIPFGIPAQGHLGLGSNSSVAVLGDLSPLPHQERIKFLINSDSTPRAKPEFVNIVFPGYDFNFISVFNLSNISFNTNLSYQSGIDYQIVPFYNSYTQYFENIKAKSINRSIIPEFMVSNYENIIKKDLTSYASNYLNLLGIERQTQIDLENFSIDFNKFIDKKSNKIKIKFDGIKKLLPYNGFYPSQRITQVIDDFYKTYLSGAGTTDREIQSFIQPFFAPGILFNTIKAGTAVDFPVNLTTSAPTNFSDLYIAAQTNDRQDPRLGLIKSGTLTHRLPFETILEPLEMIKSGSESGYRISYLDPTHYSQLLTQQYTSSLLFPTCRFSPLNNNITIETLYKSSINNFLSEIPNFFLQNSQLTYFSSAPESAFKQFIDGRTYKLRIRAAKSANYSAFKASIGANTQVLDIQTLFGPPVEGEGNILNSTDNYHPFVPPYLSNTGNEIIISFTPDRSGSYTLEEILSKAYVEQLQLDGNYSHDSAMTLEACLNWEQKSVNKTVIFDAQTGEPKDLTSDKDFKWVVQTKFEVPLIDFTDVVAYSFDFFLPKISSSGSYSGGFTSRLKTNRLEGIWTSYGTIPKDGESIQISLDDNGFENSLLQAVGFKKETKSIGRFADNKTISEAIVLLPYKEAPKVIGRNILEEYTYNQAENAYLFKISESKINNLLGLNGVSYKDLDDKNDGLRVSKIKQILETSQKINRNNSIVQQMLKMVNYNIPPHLNWLYNIHLEPFVMYIAEFKHTLDKQDLADIWQGTMPKIAKTPEEEEVTIEHFLTENELFEGLDLRKISKAKGKVFKIKKRANNNYYSLTADIEDDQKYTFGNGQEYYGYNWPYDYFSLVELVNIQAGEIYDSTPAPVQINLIPLTDTTNFMPIALPNFNTGSNQ